MLQVTYRHQLLGLAGASLTPVGKNPPMSASNSNAIESQ